MTLVPEPSVLSLAGVALAAYGFCVGASIDSKHVVALSQFDDSPQLLSNDMKIAFAAFGVLVLSVLDAHGQGQIRFFNTGQTLISTNSPSGGPAAPISGAGNYYFALFIAPPGTIDPQAFTFSGFYGTNTTAAGIFTGGQVTFPTYMSGTTLSFLVRGWSANIGSDYSSVTNYLAAPTFLGWYGDSEIGTMPLGGGATPVPNLFGIGVSQIPGFTLELHGVPEPSSLTLAGLGLVAVWLLRRRSP